MGSPFATAVSITYPMPDTARISSALNPTSLSLLTKARDHDSDVMCFADIFRPPNGSEQIFMGEHLVLVAHQRGKDFEFSAGKMNRA